ncbi:MAG: hypothetical protein K2K54_00070 [Lachnospiraceae bacterium]|nr:hypothetical protein [Lachnospiraceae bacterium]
MHEKKVLSVRNLLKAGWILYALLSIAIIDTADNDRTSVLLEQFKSNISKKNRQVKNLDLSIACGSASGRENSVDIEKTYQIADDRMYEH